MEYTIKSEGAFTVVGLAGEVDLHFSPKAREQILAQLNGSRNVLVDLSKVSYIDSSGVASLVEGFQLARTKKLRFALVGVSDAAMQVFQLARLDKVFPIYANIGEAMK